MEKGSALQAGDARFLSLRGNDENSFAEMTYVNHRKDRRGYGAMRLLSLVALGALRLTVSCAVNAHEALRILRLHPYHAMSAHSWHGAVRTPCSTAKQE